MARARLPRREAQVMRALVARAKRGAVVALTADIARDIGLPTGNVSCILRALVEAGMIDNPVRASRSKPGTWRILQRDFAEAARPRGIAIAKLPESTPPVAARLFDWIAARLDAAGEIQIGTRDMAHGVEAGVSTVETLLARWKAVGAVRVLRRGGPFGPTRWRFDVSRREVAAGCSSGNSNKTAGSPACAAACGRAENGDPPLRAPAPIATRCPKCELPPHHPDCRHGWDGRTTRAMRRDNALIAAGELGASPTISKRGRIAA